MAKFHPGLFKSWSLSCLTAEKRESKLHRSSVNITGHNRFFREQFAERSFLDRYVMLA